MAGTRPPGEPLEPRLPPGVLVPVQQRGSRAGGQERDHCLHGARGDLIAPSSCLPCSAYCISSRSCAGRPPTSMRSCPGTAYPRSGGRTPRVRTAPLPSSGPVGTGRTAGRVDPQVAVRDPACRRRDRGRFRGQGRDPAVQLRTPIPRHAYRCLVHRPCLAPVEAARVPAGGQLLVPSAGARRRGEPGQIRLALVQPAVVVAGAQPPDRPGARTGDPAGRPAEDRVSAGRTPGSPAGTPGAPRPSAFPAGPRACPAARPGPPGST